MHNPAFRPINERFELQEVLKNVQYHHMRTGAANDTLER